MEPVSRLIERNRDSWQDGKSIMWINPPGDEGWRTLRHGDTEPLLFCQYRALYRHHKAGGAAAQWGAFPTGAHLGHVILTQPRSRQRLAMMLQCVRSLMNPQATLWLAGENRTGIKSCQRLLGGHFGKVIRHDSARKCVLWRAVDPLKTEKPFTPADHVVRWPLELAGCNLEVASFPGVFAHGRLDAGTSMLMGHLANLAGAGRFLDFGCGSGVIGACLLQHSPGRDVTLLDNDGLALEAARLTLEENNLKARLLASDGFDEAETIYDVIVSNPPFHAGVRADARLTPRLLGGIGHHLANGGQLLLVANRHLPYHSWLEKMFRHIEIVERDNHFQVIRAWKKKI